MPPTSFVLVAVVLAYVVSTKLWLWPMLYHLLSHVVKAAVTQKAVPHFTSDFGEPQYQSCSGSLSLLAEA